MTSLYCGLDGLHNCLRCARAVGFFKNVGQPLAGLQHKRVSLLNDGLVSRSIAVFFHIEHRTCKDLVTQVGVEERGGNQLLEPFNRFAPEQMLSEPHGRVNENRERVHVGQVNAPQLASRLEVEERMVPEIGRHRLPECLVFLFSEPADKRPKDRWKRDAEKPKDSREAGEPVSPPLLDYWIFIRQFLADLLHSIRGYPRDVRSEPDEGCD